MPRREDKPFVDPYAGFNFLVQFQGIISGAFNEVTGLNVEAAVIEYREGENPMTQRKLPGLLKYGNVTLKRGVVGNHELYSWIKKVIDGDIERQNVTVILQSELREEEGVVQWILKEAWPCKFMAPDLKAGADEVAIETLELCNEGIRRIE